MVEIAPFRGIVYNPDRSTDISVLVAPPCGAVPAEEQSLYHQCHPCNAMNLDFGAALPNDSHPFEWHYRAAIEFNRWLCEGLLIRHKEPAIYLHETVFAHPENGESLSRLGFICLLRLEDLEPESMVKPHERTFSSYRAERLRHLEHVQANLSQVFGIYPDPEGRTIEVLEAGRKGRPYFDFKDQAAHRHRLWPLWDNGVIKRLRALLEPKTVYIADGHHRYVSSLEYRRLRAERGMPVGPSSPLNYIMVYLCAASDPGLTILSNHRLITRPVSLSREELEQGLARFFKITTFPMWTEEAGTPLEIVKRHMREAGRDHIAFGLFTRTSDVFYLLEKRLDHQESAALAEWPEILRQFDTVVLGSFIFQEVLGMTDEDLDDPSLIKYSQQSRSAIEQVRVGRAELAVLHNPPRIEQVQAVADAGLIMPRKSTFFYPKVLTGLVFNPVNPYEEVEEGLA